jgi:hypothetical protein
MFLMDSGGQYLDGTTDVTRTVHFGTPTAHQIECFTRVLIGHIRLAQTVFPGTTALLFDISVMLPLRLSLYFTLFIAISRCLVFFASVPLFYLLGILPASISTVWRFSYPVCM